MELTRRDALAALAAAGVAGGGALALSAGESRDDGETATEPGGVPPPGPLTDDDVAVLTAAAEVLYPSEVEGVESFVSEFARGRAAEQPDHAAGVADAARYLDEWTGSWLDEEFTALDPSDREEALDPSDREEALDRLGARAADPDPEGTDAERVRYYVVDELLFALYSSPTGGELVGIENPQGHPGGTESYRRGPNDGE
ncbi:gluconate 2-dehydrogenase subunit 3 family protein [Halosimplex salinum]|uniref:gluconate 2-dehydrogenase subunit 3 family protein n=1 Tax=Halosimplex salinum TaxID=1710538 RepID=UPI000F4690AF|nr:gluconate 2-dehydrogenase subunit 3 family protein [Halosimplex salinum]